MGNSALTVNGGTIAFVNNPTTTGDYRLFAYGTVLPAGLSNFTLPTQSGETYSLSTSADSGYVNLIAASSGTTVSSGATWSAIGNGSWSNGGNWSSGTAPTTGTVTFAGNPSAPGHGHDGWLSDGHGLGLQYH